MSSLIKIKKRGLKIGKFWRPISECNHLLYARKRYHNYVGRSSEATGTRDRPFRASKKSKIEVRKSGNFGGPFQSATTSYTLEKGIIIMWADHRKRLEHEIGHFEPQKNQKSMSENRVNSAAHFRVQPPPIRSKSVS